MEGTKIRLSQGETDLTITLNLLGDFQLHNLATVFEILKQLKKIGLIKHIDMIKGVEQTNWKGRLEYHHGNPNWFFDVGHNPHALKVLKSTLDNYLQFDDRVLLYGAAMDKDYRSCLPWIEQLSPEIYLTSGFYRSIETTEIAGSFSSPGLCRGRFTDLETGIDYLNDQFRNSSKSILVVGSVFLVGAAKQLICPN